MKLTQIPERCVIDASVAIKLLVEEPLSDQVDLLFSRLVENPNSHLYVPDIFYAECANILWKYTMRFGMTKTVARRNLKHLEALAFEQIGTANFIEDVLDVALQYGVTVYDACYVALARRVQAPLITADERLARKIGSEKEWVITLASLPKTNGK